jgi:hypothetical protein
MIPSLLLWLLAGPIAPLAAPQEPVMESVLPSLAYGRSCVSTIQLQNLGEAHVVVDLEAHRGSGALAPLAGLPRRAIPLAPGERGTYQLRIEDDDPAAWVKVRERLPALHATPVVAVSGATACHQGTATHTAARPVAYPTRNPWFAGEVADLPGAVLTLVNLSATAAQASLCYSFGTLVGVPGDSPASRELRTLCSATQEVQVPAFGTRQFPVERDGNSYFSLRTRGDSLILQLLRPSPAAASLFTVDSSIKFGQMLPPVR